VIPFFKDIVLNLGVFFVLFGAFVMVAPATREPDRRSRRLAIVP